jgi:hypothetical protein
MQRSASAAKMLQKQCASLDSRLRSIALRSNPSGPLVKRAGGSAGMRKIGNGIVVCMPAPAAPQTN